jgi:hypothetical protein
MDRLQMAREFLFLLLVSLECSINCYNCVKSNVLFYTYNLPIKFYPSLSLSLSVVWLVGDCNFFAALRVTAVLLLRNYLNIYRSICGASIINNIEVGQREYRLSSLHYHNKKIIPLL